MSKTTTTASSPKTATAKARYIRVAPRKVRAVAGLLRGLPVQEAEAQLLHQRRRAAVPLLKLLRAATQNAANARSLAADRLYVQQLTVDQGPKIRGYLPRARGMATTIEKKMSHVTIVLAEAASPKAQRFTIVRPRKRRHVPGSDTAEARKKQREREERRDPVKKQDRRNFLRRIFRRKSASGE